MRRELTVALLLLLPAPFALGQQTIPPAPPTVYYAGPGVTAPQFLSIPMPSNVPGHCKKNDGTAILFAIVSPEGAAHDVATYQPDDPLIDTFANTFVTTHPFKPGTFDGSPAPVAVYIALKLQVCTSRGKDAEGGKSDQTWLRSLPTVSIGIARSHQTPIDRVFSGVSIPLTAETTTSAGISDSGAAASAPVPTFAPDPHYSPDAKEKRIQGKCLIGLIVDAEGTPRNAHIVKSLEPSLDRNAIEAINIWWFKPAIREGVPVPVEITVEMNFRLY